jgi:parvulin-like peptidyl-prolyl isomerase
MVKRLIIALVFSLFVYTREAYAVFDFVATLESQLEGFQKTLSKYQEIMKKASDAYTRAKRGFDAVDGCIRRPKTCFAAIKELKSGLSKINMMSSVSLPEDKALLEVSSGEMVEEIEKAVYVKGQGQDIKKIGEKKAEINAVVAADVAALWAKAVSTRQAILAENDEEQYNAALKGGVGEDEANMEKLLASQQMLSLLSARRVNRILELRSYMMSAPATFVVMGHSVEKDGSSGE